MLRRLMVSKLMVSKLRVSKLSAAWTTWAMWTRAFQLIAWHGASGQRGQPASKCRACVDAWTQNVDNVDQWTMHLKSVDPLWGVLLSTR